MTQITQPKMREIIDLAFANLANKDLSALLSLMSPEARLIDPHFPRQEITGSIAIKGGLTEAFKNMRSMGYNVDKFFTGEDGRSAAVEVATNHVLKNGKVLNFSQTFIFEFEDVYWLPSPSET